MNRPGSLSRKLGLVGATLLALVLTSIAVTLSVTWKLEGGAAAVNEAGRLRMQAWRLAQTLPEPDAGRLDALVATFDDSLRLLREGDPSRPLILPQDGATLQRLAQVEQHWLQLRRDWRATPPDGQAHRVPQASAQTEAFVAQIDALVSAVEHQLARDTAVLNAFQLTLMGLAIGSAVTLVYAAYLFVLNPLGRLQEGLARVETGDLSARVPEEGRDEFSALAVAFNRMARTLQGLYEGLEKRVQEKTRTLQVEQTRLAALYEAAAFVARTESLDELARGFSRQLRRVAGADAVAVRWSDEQNQRYLLLAHDGLPQALADVEHCLPTGGCHCGQAARAAHTRVIPIAELGVSGRAGPDTRLRCIEHGFATVVSVPVQTHERLVGELNLFFRHPPSLDAHDHALLETLASHLASAIESLRTAALEREAAVAEERALLARELHDSIAQGLAFLKIQAALLRQARAQGDDRAVDRTLAELDAGIHESLADVRELLVHFRTRTNQEDIGPALRSTLQKFEHQTGLDTSLAVTGEGLPLPADVQVQVLHVVQEALSNVRKHAQATRVWVEVDAHPPWTVRVRDNGRGFDAAAASPDATHVGLAIMCERAGRVGAVVDIRSNPGQGTCVTLALPAGVGAAHPPEPAVAAEGRGA